MNPEAFYEVYIEPHLDEYISFEFERISIEFLWRKYKNVIQEISGYWYNSAKLKQNIEIDIVMKKSDGLYAFECNWTNQLIDKKNEEHLTSKIPYLGENIRIGFFSKSGYSSGLSQSSLRFIPSDLYDL